MSDPETVQQADVLPKLEKLGELDVPQLVELRDELLVEVTEHRKVERHLRDLPGNAPARDRGILAWLASKPAEAAETLEKVKDPVCVYVRAKALDEIHKSREALELLGSSMLDEGGDLAKLLQLDLLAKLREWDTLASEVKKLEKSWKDRADLFYYQGLLAETEGSYEEAEDLYEKALSLDDAHTRALFRLAYRLDMRGEDSMAMEFYERCTRAQPPHLNAFMNLGVMYEDVGDYEKAAACFRRVVNHDPTHARARLFLKDAEASIDMYYDEDEEKKEDRLNQILRIPVTDFELSVRSRNCLEKMNLRILGDLIRMTEAELLSFKNFGETSLAEIKEILASKGLRLGMQRESEGESASARMRQQRTATLQPSGDALSKPLSELELSVRSRRAMAVLDIQTVGELTQRSAEELKGVKNFGSTSLNEIKRKLGELGLSLKS